MRLIHGGNSTKKVVSKNKVKEKPEASYLMWRLWFYSSSSIYSMISETPHFSNRHNWLMGIGGNTVTFLDGVISRP